MTTAGILGFGSFLPPHVRSNDFWPQTFRPQDDAERNKDLLDVQRSARGEAVQVAPEIAEAMAEFGSDPFRGARTRHVIDDGVEVSDMEAEACRRAMRNAGVRPDQIDLLLIHSVLPDMIQPTNGPAVQIKCELSNAAAWTIDVACASLIAEMQTATALIQTGAHRHVLCVASYAPSRFVDYANPASTGLGDGAAAIVMGPVEPGFGVLGTWMRTDGAMRDGVVITTVVDGVPQRRWDRCSGPARITSLNIDYGKTGGLQVAHACPQAGMGALENAGLKIEDVALLVCNQSLGWMAGACRRALGLPAGRSIDTFSEIGNIGAAAIAFNLERAAQEKRLNKGDVVLCFSQGAGFSRGALVYRWSGAEKHG
jgi:3-oxoacyl-[acyl-carrier-protein] synthase-3